MATYVIHGTGKPRFAITEPAIYADKTHPSTPSTSTNVTLAAGTDLALLELNYGLVGRIINTRSATGAETRGIITGYSETPDILRVSSWSNGNPDTDRDLTIKNIQIDLPYCQELRESFSPDFIIKKMFNGDINVRKRGFYYNATLDYSKFIIKTNLSLLRHLYTTRDRVITFYPRLDNTKIAYRVDIDDSEILFYQIQKFQGHRGVKINLVGTQRLADAQIFDLTGTTGYGVDYGSNYGTNF